MTHRVMHRSCPPKPGGRRRADLTPGDIVVCINLSVPLMFSDNATGACADCGQALQFRPVYAPTIDKVCFSCASRRMEAHARR